MFDQSQACYEAELVINPPNHPKKLPLLVGAGMSASVVLAKRGHDVTLFEAKDVLGGQFNYAKVIPGEEFLKPFAILEMSLIIKA